VTASTISLIVAHQCRDDHYYQLQSERSRLQLEKDTLEKAHLVLVEDHRSLQSQLDDVLSERDDAFARTRELLHQTDTRRSDKTDVSMKADMDRLRADLYVVKLPLKIHSSYHPSFRQKSEENLAVTESELEKQTRTVADLTHRVDELQGYEAEAARLKDQVDE
jgi:protein HOOK3